MCPTGRDLIMVNHCPYFVYAWSEGSVETAHMRKLVLVYAAHWHDMYQTSCAGPYTKINHMHKSTCSEPNVPYLVFERHPYA